MEANKVLDKYNLMKKIELECSKKKISTMRYDVPGYYKICIDVLQKEWIQHKQELEHRLIELRLTIIDKTDDEKITYLRQEMEEISSAQKVFEEIIKKDLALR